MLEAIRREFWDASHHCFAYQLAPDGAVYRSFDDGEPNGSAGKPILLAVQQANLFDVVVVVTRYFGGTKLGVGGLARAYGEAAREALAASTPLERFDTEQVRVFSPYDDVGRVRHLVEQVAESFDEEFKDVVIYTATVRTERIASFALDLTDATAGRAGLVPIEEGRLE